MKKKHGSPPESVQEAAEHLYTPGGGWRMMAAGEFKATCLRLLDEVRDTGEEIVVTKHGRPVAKLVPLTGADIRPFVGRSSGVIEAAPADLMAPEGADWELGDDL